VEFEVLTAVIMKINVFWTIMFFNPGRSANFLKKILPLASRLSDRLCGLVVRVTGYRSRGPGSILGATRFSEK
jgi:hypothetical protein